MPYKRGDEPVPSFRLVKLLGRGGFGEVWKATAPGGVLAALKIINLTSDHGYKEFRAIRLVKHINHPNLVHTIGFWLKDEEGKLFEEDVGDNSLVVRAQAAELIIAMGLGDKNLFDRLKECQLAGMSGIPADELVEYMEPAARAIDFLNQPIHDLGAGPLAIQHCDIKPQNILIVGGSAQVCDFGLARVLGDNPATQVGATAFYAAPEVLNGNQPSKFTDQYSLAITFYHLLTGCLPFDSKAQTAAMIAHISGRLEFSKVSEPLQAILRRATSLQPEKRFGSCVEMMRELRRLLDSARSTATKWTTDNPSLLIEIGQEIVPGYRIVRPIGKGGYGEVWEASAPGGKHVALKIIRNLECPKGLQEFKSLEVIKGVEHNHLIELHAYWLLDRHGEVIPDEMRDRPDAPPPSMLVIASRLAHKNLLDRLKECRKDGLQGIPVDELIYDMVQVASAIDHLNSPQHPHGDQLIAIQHRDIKPENILLARDNTVKLADFGLAKILESANAVIHGSSAGLTPAYAAPEMITGTVTSWSDQYSLAITYYQLRTGTMPFEKHISLPELIQIHLNGKLDLSKLPEPERVVITQATQLKPEDRFPDCASMVRALQRACGLSGSFGDVALRPPSSGSFEIVRPRPTEPPTALPAAVVEQPTPTAQPPLVLPSRANVPTQVEIVVMEEPSPTRTFAKPVQSPGETDSEIAAQDTRSNKEQAPAAREKPAPKLLPEPAPPPPAHDDLDASLKPTSGIKVPPRPPPAPKTKERPAPPTPAPPTPKKPQEPAWRKNKASSKRHRMPAPVAGSGVGERLLQSSKALGASAAGATGKALRALLALRPSPERSRSLGKTAAILLVGAMVLGGAVVSYYLVTKGLVQSALQRHHYASALETVKKWWLPVAPLPAEFKDDAVRDSWLKHANDLRTSAFADAERLAESDRQFAQIAQRFPAEQEACDKARAEIVPELTKAWLKNPGYPQVLTRISESDWTEANRDKAKGQVRDAQLTQLRSIAGSADRQVEAVTRGVQLQNDLSDPEGKIRTVVDEARTRIRAKLSEQTRLEDWQGVLQKVQPAFDQREVNELVDRRYSRELQQAQASRDKDLGKAAQLCDAALTLAKTHALSLAPKTKEGLEAIVAEYRVRALGALDASIAKLAAGDRSLFQECRAQVLAREKEGGSSPELAEMKALVEAFNPDTKSASLAWPQVREGLSRSATHRLQFQQAAVALAQTNEVKLLDVLAALQPNGKPLASDPSYEPLRQQTKSFIAQRLGDARKSIAGGAVAGAQQALEEAKQAGLYLPEMPERRQFEVLQTRVGLKDQNRRSQAVAWIRDNFDKVDKSSQSELIGGLRDATKDTSFPSTALPLLEPLKTSNPELLALVKEWKRGTQPPPKASEMVTKIRSAWQANPDNPDAVLKAFEEERPASGWPPEAAAVLADVQAWAWLRNGTKEQKKDAAVRVVALLNGDQLPPHVDKLSADLAKAGKDLGDTVAARQTLQKLVERPDLPKQRANAIGAELSQLVTEHIGTEYRRGLAQLRWDILKKDLDGKYVNPKDAWVALARAECLAETATDNAAERAKLEAASGAIQPGNSPDPALARYVRARAAEILNPDAPEKAAEELYTAFSAPSEAFDDPTRRKRQIEMLERGADKLGASVNWNSLDAKFDPQQAQAVYNWLLKAKELLGKDNQPLPAAQLARLAVAAESREKPNRELVKTLAMDPVALNSDDAKKDLPFALLQAQVLSADTDAKLKQRAFTLYSAIVHRFDPSARNPVKPEELVARVLRPAVMLGEAVIGQDSQPAATKQLAECYFQLGQRLSAFPSFPKDEATQTEALGAYARALELTPKDPIRAEYLYRRDLAQWSAAKADYSQFESDANEGLLADPEHAGCHFLRGYVLARRVTSKAESSPDDKQTLEEAVKEYGKGIVRLEKTGDPLGDLPFFYGYRMNAINYLVDRKDSGLDEKIAWLKKAEKDAQQAIDSGGSDKAHAQLGNILERLAWQCNQKEYYPKAIAAWESAWDKELNPRYGVDWSRVLLRSIESDPYPNPERAAKQLKKIQSRLSKLVNDKLDAAAQAEVRLTLGRTLAEQASEKQAAKFAEAEREYEKVIASAPQESAGIVNLALEASARLALSRAELAKEKRDNVGLEKALKDAGDRATELEKRATKRGDLTAKKPVLAFIRGKALELKPDADALAAFKAYDIDEKTPELLRATLELLVNDRFSADFRAKRDENPKFVPANMRSLALDLVKAEEKSKGAVGRAYGILGLVIAESVSQDDKPEDARKTRLDAVEKLREAIKKTPDTALDSWRWHFELANQLKFLLQKLETDPKEIAKDKKEGLEHLAKIEARIPRRLQREFERLRDALK